MGTRDLPKDESLQVSAHVLYLLAGKKVPSTSIALIVTTPFHIDTTPGTPVPCHPRYHCVFKIGVAFPLWIVIG